MKRRRAMAAALLAVVLVVGGHFTLWRWAGTQLEQGLAQQSGLWRAQGWTVASGATVRGGWPLHARLTVPGLALSGPFGPPGGIAWSAQAVVLDVALLHPGLLTVELIGQQQLRVGPGPAIPVSAKMARAVLPLTPGVPPQRLDLALTGLRAGPPGAVLEAARATLGLEEQPGATASEPAVSVTLDAADIALPPAPRGHDGGQSWALGGRIDSLSLEADVTGPLSALPDPQARAEAWRDGGGTVAVRRLALHWGPLNLDGSATLALDGALQPMGTASMRLTGQAPTLDALAAGHVVTPQVAQAAKAVLALMAHPPAGGGPPEVDVPLALQDRMLSMGRIPLLHLPVLLWPDLVWSTAP